MPSNPLGILSKIDSAINKSYQLNEIDAKEADALYVMSYIAFCISACHHQPTLLPIKEFNLLRETIAKANFPPNHGLLPKLLVQLITITDILIERIPNGDHLNTLTITFKTLPDSLIEQVPVASTSRSALHLFNVLNKPIKFIGQVREDISVQQTNLSDDEQIDTDQLLNKIKQIKGANQNRALDSTIYFLCRDLIRSFAKKMLSEEIFTVAIRQLYANSSGKETVINNFFGAYNVVYTQDAWKRRDSALATLYLTKGMALFIPLLESLNPKNFHRLISRLELKNPLDDELHSEYNCYLTILSFYQRDEVPHPIRRARLEFVAEDKYMGTMFSGLAHTFEVTIKASTSRTLSGLPSILQADFANLDPSILSEFEKFIDLLVRVNTQAPRQQQRNIDLFLLKHHFVILQFIHIMGVEGIRYMQNHVARTVLNLENYF